ncbi:MAG TPA: MFS transporter [Dehalococcoidia bacterium]|nr:MFS transporter [Dehalococcoidia bacterium]HIN23331.1 MFS transporter [Dehalococcoidia bacterium]
MLNQIPLVRKARGAYYGWWVLSATFALGVLSGGIFSHSNAIFFGPIKRDLGLNSTQTSLIFSLVRAEGSFAGPIVGRFVDKFGARPMIIFGGLLASAGFMALSWVHNYVLFVVIFVGVVGVGKSSGLGQVLISAVNRWFIRRRSLAMSICITGFASGGAVLLPLISIGVSTIGWRDVMLYSGIFMAIMVVPLGSMVGHSPERMGIGPDLPRPQDGKTAVQTANIDFTVRQALRTRSYWILFGGSVLRITMWGAISVHSVEMFVWKGMSQGEAGLMFSLIFFLSIPMRLGVGILGDRVPLQPMMGGGMVAAALAVVAMLVLDGNTAVYLFVVLMAMEQGGSTLNWVALGNFFGRTNFATLMGIISTAFNLGMLVSPVYAGYMFDRTGSYTVVLISFLPIYLTSGVLFLMTRKPEAPVAARTPVYGR